MRNNAGNVITFPIDEPNAYTVEWGGSAMNAMYVFANAIDYDAPTQSTDTVKYIGPGDCCLSLTIKAAVSSLGVCNSAVCTLRRE